MVPKETAKRLVVIDGKSVFYRGYYAMSNLSTKDGTPTGGVYGFAVMALEVLKRLKPDYVAVAWDKPKTNIRKRVALYPQYKAGRKPPPPDFYEQIPLLHELLEAFGWPLYELDDYEADDILGTLATKASKEGIETLLVTSDLDMLQVVGPLVKVYALKTGLSNIELYSPASFTAKYGLRPDQFMDLKALKGDSSDNIPGAPGIGEKTAVALLQQYDTIEGIYENIDLIKEATRKKLIAGRELVDVSRKLAELWTDAPVPLDLDAMDGHHANPARIREVLERLEFRTLVRQLPEVMQLKDDDEVPVHAHFSAGDVSVTILDTAEALAELSFSKTEPVYVHSRSAGKHGARPKYLVLSQHSRRAFVLDLTQVPQPKLAAILAAGVVGYDVKASLQVLLELGVPLPHIQHDVQIAAFVLDSLRREQTLTAIAEDMIGYDGSPFEDLSDEEYVARAGELMAVLRAVHTKQAEALAAAPKFPELVREIEWPVIPVLAEMEWRGIQLDTQYLADFAVQIDDAISDLSQQIYGYADQEFNISSPAQLAEVLFDTLELPSQGIKKGKTGYSTAASELDKLRGQHPIIDLITSYREVTKLKNTYVDTLPLLVDENSRVHTTFNLTIAQTGRLSSTDPNLQNIPVRTELGKHIRTAFVAGEGNVFVSADYSQFELRLAAVMSGDKDMIESFNSGADIHTITAAQVYGRDIEDVTKQMRYAAKAINFGILYGMSPHGLAIAANMTFEQAAHFIEKYKELRPALFTYMNSIKEFARKEGYVETLFGRRRPMPDIKSSNFVVRGAAERAAINMPIQGTEADLMKLAMVRANEKLRAVEGADMLLQIHDSILVECKEADAERIAKLLQETMETVAPSLPVKLAVDTTTGKNWGDL